MRPEEKSVSFAKSKHLGDGIRAAIAARSPCSSRSGASAPRASGGDSRRPRRSPGLRDLGWSWANTSSDYFDTGIKGREGDEAHALQLPRTLRGFQCKCQEIPEAARPSEEQTHKRARTRTLRTALASSPGAHTARLGFPMPLNRDGGLASWIQCKSDKAGAGPRKLQEHR